MAGLSRCLWGLRLKLPAALGDFANVATTAELMLQCTRIILNKYVSQIHVSKIRSEGLFRSLSPQHRVTELCKAGLQSPLSGHGLSNKLDP